MGNRESQIQTFYCGHHPVLFFGFWKFVLLRAPGHGIAENDGVGDLLHRTPPLLAFPLQHDVGLFFGDVQIALQNSFGAFHQFAGFKKAGQLRVLAFEAGHLDFCADQKPMVVMSEDSRRL